MWYADMIIGKGDPFLFFKVLCQSQAKSPGSLMHGYTQSHGWRLFKISKKSKIPCKSHASLIRVVSPLRMGIAQLAGKKRTPFLKCKIFKMVHFFEIYTIWASFNANKTMWGGALHKCMKKFRALTSQTLGVPSSVAPNELIFLYKLKTTVLNFLAS